MFRASMSAQKNIWVRKLPMERSPHISVQGSFADFGFSSGGCHSEVSVSVNRPPDALLT